MHMHLRRVTIVEVPKLACFDKASESDDGPAETSKHSSSSSLENTSAEDGRGNNDHNDGLHVHVQREDPRTISLYELIRTHDSTQTRCARDGCVT